MTEINWKYDPTFFRLGVFVFTLAAAVGAVRSVDFAISRIGILSDVTAENDPHEFHDYLLAESLADPVNFQVKGVKIGTRYLDILKLIGKAVETTDDDMEYYGLILKYEGLEIALSRAGSHGPFIVVAVEISSDRWDVNGLRTGMRATEMRKYLGIPLGIPLFENQKSAAYPIEYSMDLNIELTNGRVTKISVYRELC